MHASAVGSPNDRIHAIAMSVAAMDDRRALECKAPAWYRCLDQLAARRTTRLDGAVAWLRATVEASKLLSEPAAAGIRWELLRRCAQLSPAAASPADEGGGPSAGTGSPSP